MKAKPAPKAVPAYENLHLAAQDLLQRIGELVENQPAPDDEVTITWSHVAEMAEVNQRLASVVEFLSLP